MANAAAADNQFIEEVRAVFTQPGHPVAFSTPARIAKHFGVSLRKAKEALEYLDPYTLHREYKQPRFYNPYYVHGRREQVQADLIDVSKLKRQNGGVCFLLLLIDIMTKKMWVYPLKNKSAREMKTKMARWVADIDVLPEKLMTDRGTEFTNGQVQELLRSNGIEWQASNGVAKAAIAERANKTLQILMYKYLTERETWKYADVLDRLVDTYNGRGHRTLKGMTPDEADLPENEARVQAIFNERYAKAAERRRLKLPFKVGDMVRIKTEAKNVSSSNRAYAEQFHGEYFVVHSINRRMPVAMYKLESMDTGEVIQGSFYKEEMQRVRGDVFKVERVLGRRRRRGVLEYKVRWLFFGPRHDSWVPAGNLTADFDRGRDGRRGRARRRR